MEVDSKYGKLNISCENVESNPHCSHGPTLLFERIQCNGNIQKFFACSAYRSRKLCTFFVPFSNSITEKKKMSWAHKNKQFLQNEQRINLCQRLNKIKQFSAKERGYCHTCSSLFHSKEESHNGHDIANPLSDYLLNHPSQLLHLKTCSKAESQFIFSKRTTNVIIDALKELNVRKVLCLGTPSIHESIRNSPSDISTVLLDLDNRYLQFYNETDFKRFNMMNFHFFDQPKSYEAVKDFLSADGVVLIMDPPFSARAEPLRYTLSKFNSIYQQFHKNTNLSVIWIFPYFKEEEVLSCYPDMTMLDYDITYKNQKLFHENTRNKTSVVRIFTNLDASKFVFPDEEGYHFCSRCNRWVSRCNKHCLKCDICPSKNGHPYKHCDLCSRCVKISWEHCKKCERCALQNHPCYKWQVNKTQFSMKRKLNNKEETSNKNQSAFCKSSIKKYKKNKMKIK